MSKTARIVVESRGDQLVSSVDPVTLGTRTGCEVVVDDTIVADRHCRFAFEDGFQVRDLGSVTGTWIDGQRASPTAAIRNGCEIIVGATRIAASIEDRDGAPTLVLDVKGLAFWWKKPGKGVFDNDPDAMVRAEVRFGRFPALVLGNRLALLVGFVLLIAATFVGAVMGPLADPGPLLPSHAFVASAQNAASDVHESFARCAALAEQQGCNVCHATGSGTPVAKCLQCHGDMQEPATRRHPYIGDGVLKSLPGVEASEGLCVLCHRDHQGADWLKPESQTLVGKCELCHSDGKAPFDRNALAAMVPVALAAERQRPYATYRFPHDAHLAKNIDCAICHHVDDDVRQRRANGEPDNPLRDDFADVPFETCASCHVPGTAPASMTAAQQEQWRAKDHQWTVRWHGTDDAGAGCAQCHSATEQGAVKRFGPALRSIERPRLTTTQHAAQRARYSSPTRRHVEQFAAHAEGKDCTVCHVRGDVKVAEAAPARAFWHALHVANGSLQPGPGLAAGISSNTSAGCVSCHGDLARAKNLQPAAAGGYHWPTDAAAQGACKECHREGKDEPLPLRAVDVAIAAEQRISAADFPHDVHVGSKAFGVAGTALADACFACHEFERPAEGAEFELVPRTKPKASDCSQCHGSHDNIAGNSCQQCHPATAERSNSFLIAAAVVPGTDVGGRKAPAPPQRSWPGATPFSHLSRGHSAPDLKCDACHPKAGIDQAKTLDAVAVPDESARACRECHLQQQFHWR